MKTIQPNPIMKQRSGAHCPQQKEGPGDRPERGQEHRATLPISRRTPAPGSPGLWRQHVGLARPRHSCSGGRRASCEEPPRQGAPYLAVHQQPDGEGDVQATFGDLGLHFLPGDGRCALAGWAAPAQKETAPRPYHLGTERGKKSFLPKQAHSLMWEGA